MTTKINSVGETLELLLSDVFWFPEDQKGERDASWKEPSKVFPKLFVNGWNVDKKGRVHVTKITPAQIKKAKALTDSLVKQWVGSSEVILYTDDDGNKIKTTAENLGLRVKLTRYDKDGKFIPPSYAGRRCYRRGDAQYHCQEAFAKAHPKDEMYTIPVKVVEYKNDWDQYLARIEENNTAGESAYAPADLLGHVCKMLTKGVDPAVIGRLLNLKNGVKTQLTNWGTIVNNYPDLKIKERLALPSPEVQAGEKIPYEINGYLPYNVLDKNNGAILAGTGESENEHNALARLAKGGILNGELATSDQVENYFKSRMEASKAAGSLTPKTLTLISDNTPNADVKHLLKSIVSGSTDGVTDAVKAIIECATKAKLYDSANTE